MTTLDYPHITTANGDAAHLERLPRIRVAQIAADHLGYGWSAEEIARQYPHLTLAEIHGSIDQCVRDLELIAKATDPADWIGQVEQLPLR